MRLEGGGGGERADDPWKQGNGCTSSGSWWSWCKVSVCAAPPPLRAGGGGDGGGGGEPVRPPDLQGLSHYLEHMPFMGSDKFPDENDYDAFLASDGGASNAYTDTVLPPPPPPHPAHPTHIRLDPFENQTRIICPKFFLQKNQSYTHIRT